MIFILLSLFVRFDITGNEGEFIRVQVPAEFMALGISIANDNGEDFKKDSIVRAFKEFKGKKGKFITMDTDSSHLEGYLLDDSEVLQPGKGEDLRVKIYSGSDKLSLRISISFTEKLFDIINMDDEKEQEEFKRMLSLLKDRGRFQMVKLMDGEDVVEVYVE
ncbi:hypothetical protein DRQ17_05100 [bacterium]|nr:MAG: hypothetical protein DRQ17_05100 [bacterium]RKZ21504.1 MAG: hypothetical protein DRQ23_06990 [bacterium]